MKKHILTALGGVFTLGLFMVSSCTPENNNNGGQGVSFDGNSYNFTTSYSSNNSSLSSPGDINITYGNSIVQSLSNLYPSLGIYYGQNSFVDASDENIQAFFTTGSKAFATETNHGAAVSIKMSGSSPTYTSIMGSPAAQSGSSFEFTNFTYHGGTPEYVEYTATFSCKLYNQMDSTDMKPISGTVNGRFMAYY